MRKEKSMNNIDFEKDQREDLDSINEAKSLSDQVVKLKNLEAKLSPCFSLSEDFSNVMIPRFNGMGEIAPEKLPLIVAGTLKNTLVSSRSEKEYKIG